MTTTNPRRWRTRAIPGHYPVRHGDGDWRCKCGVNLSGGPLGTGKVGAQDVMRFHRKDLLDDSAWREPYEAGREQEALEAFIKAHVIPDAETFVGPIPGRSWIDHLCHNADPTCPGGTSGCKHRLCCNPEHLEATTPLENTRRARGPRRAQALTAGTSWPTGDTP